MSNKDFKVKNGLQVPSLTTAGIVTTDENGNISSAAVVPISNGGTGQTTSGNALNALLPLQTNKDNQYLQTNGISSQWNAIPVTVYGDEPESPILGQIWADPNSTATSYDPNIITRTSFTATAGQTEFTVSSPFIDSYEQVFFNGMLLLRNTDYTTSDGVTVALAAAAAANDIIEIVSIVNVNAYVVNPYFAISSNTNLLAGYRYFVTSASALTLTLPASPNLNDQIEIFDASGNANTYNITIARNSKKINGNAGNLIIDTAGSWMTLVYTGSTYGWKAA